MHFDPSIARHALPHPLASLYTRLLKVDPWIRLEVLNVNYIPALMTITSPRVDPRPPQ